MPRKLVTFLIRHTQSEANKNLKMNRRKPDSAISLNDEGLEQGLLVGDFLKNYIQKKHYLTK